jgi:hypothetical protein
MDLFAVSDIPRSALGKAGWGFEDEVQTNSDSNDSGNSDGHHGAASNAKTSSHSERTATSTDSKSESSDGSKSSTANNEGKSTNSNHDVIDDRPLFKDVYLEKDVDFELFMDEKVPSWV